MATILFSTMAAAVVLFYNLIPQWKSGQKKAFLISLCTTAVAYGMMVWTNYMLSTPSLMRPLSNLIRTLFKL